MFKENKTLIHMDLSHNGFKKTEIDVMSEGLKANHTILGLHMLGNDLSTNSQGFLTEREDNPGASHIMTRIEPSLETGTLSKEKSMMKIGSNCWICEGWTQMLF